jgi:hypothetical protein
MHAPGYTAWGGGVAAQEAAAARSDAAAARQAHLAAQDVAKALEQQVTTLRIQLDDTKRQLLVRDPSIPLLARDPICEGCAGLGVWVPILGVPLKPRSTCVWAHVSDRTFNQHVVLQKQRHLLLPDDFTSISTTSMFCSLSEIELGAVAS